MDGLHDIFLPRLINLLITISIILLAVTFCSKKPEKLEQKLSEEAAKSPTVSPSVVKSTEKSKESLDQESKKKSEHKMNSKKEKSAKKKMEEKSNDKKKKKMEKSGELRIMSTQPSSVSIGDDGELESDSIGTAQIEVIHHTPSQASKERVAIWDKKPRKDRVEASPGIKVQPPVVEMKTAN